MNHHRALPHREVADALATVDGSGSSLTAKLAFRFVVLTAARGGEVRGATWEEIDLEAREWRIPASRMKAGTLHRVPLSDAAMAVLEEARPLSGGTGLIFPSPTGRGGLSNMTLTKILRDNGLADRATVHGMRSAFRDWCADSGVSPRDRRGGAGAYGSRSRRRLSPVGRIGAQAHRHGRMGDYLDGQRHRQGGPAARLTDPTSSTLARLVRAFF